MYGLLILCSLCQLPATTPGDSGDSVMISTLLADIARLQQRAPGFYQKGAFPSTRIHLSRPQAVRQDNNIFFTGLIGFGLRRLRPYFQGADRDCCDSILECMQTAFRPYRNRVGRLTYNFWRTDPPQIFPGDPWLKLLDRSHALADDLDDTMILVEAMGGVRDSARVLKAEMEVHAGGSRRRAYRGYRRYRHWVAYSTWFGRRMPVDYDASVLCNILYWVYDSRLPLSPTDSATIALLKDMILRELPLKDPSFASPHYSRSPVILYHIGRLLGTFSIPALDSLKPLLIAQTRVALEQAKTPMDRVLLATTLLRLGVPPGEASPQRVPPGGASPALTAEVAAGADPAPLLVDPDDPDFVFFIASFSDYLTNPFRRIFLHSPLLKYEFRCSAYNRFLLLEYLVLRQASWKRFQSGV